MGKFFKRNLGSCVGIFVFGVIIAGCEMVPTTSDQEKVTFAEMDQIETGMTYEEVVEIIGFEGEINSENEQDGIKTVKYVWKNPGFGKLSATFQNNKLVSFWGGLLPAK